MFRLHYASDADIAALLNDIRDATCTEKTNTHATYVVQDNHTDLLLHTYLDDITGDAQEHPFIRALTEAGLTPDIEETNTDGLKTHHVTLVMSGDGTKKSIACKKLQNKHRQLFPSTRHTLLDDIIFTHDQIRDALCHEEDFKSTDYTLPSDDPDIIVLRTTLNSVKDISKHPFVVHCLSRFGEQMIAESGDAHASIQRYGIDSPVHDVYISIPASETYRQKALDALRDVQNPLPKTDMEAMLFHALQKTVTAAFPLPEEKHLVLAQTTDADPKRSAYTFKVSTLSDLDTQTVKNLQVALGREFEVSPLTIGKNSPLTHAYFNITLPAQAETCDKLAQIKIPAPDALMHKINIAFDTICGYAREWPLTTQPETAVRVTKEQAQTLRAAELTITEHEDSASRNVLMCTLKYNTNTLNKLTAIQSDHVQKDLAAEAYNTVKRSIDIIKQAYNISLHTPRAAAEARQQLRQTHLSDGTTALSHLQRKIRVAQRFSSAAQDNRAIKVATWAKALHAHPKP